MYVALTSSGDVCVCVCVGDNMQTHAVGGVVTAHRKERCTTHKDSDVFRLETPLRGVQTQFQPSLVMYLRERADRMCACVLGCVHFGSTKKCPATTSDLAFENGILLYVNR